MREYMEEEGKGPDPENTEVAPPPQEGASTTASPPETITPPTNEPATPSVEVPMMSREDTIRSIQAMFTGISQLPPNERREIMAGLANAIRNNMEAGEDTSIQSRGPETPYVRLSQMTIADVEDEIDDLLRRSEEDRVDFKQESMHGIQEILQYINSVPLKDERDPKISDLERERIKERKARIQLTAYSRITYHTEFRAQQKASTEDAVNTLRSVELRMNNEVVNTWGVKTALKAISANEGAYFRKEESDSITDKDLDASQNWLVNRRTEIIKQDLLKVPINQDIAVRDEKGDEAKDANGNVIYRRSKERSDLFGKLQDESFRTAIKLTLIKDTTTGKNLTIEQATEKVLKDYHISKGLKDKDLDSAIAQDHKLFIRLIWESRRAFDLAEKICHVTGVSSRWDGIRWKKEVIRTEGKTSSLAEPDKVPMTFWYEENGRKVWVKVNLAKPPADGTPEKVIFDKVMESMRGNAAYLARTCWNKAKREFVRDNWDKFDFDVANGSFSGRAPTGLKRLFNFPGYLERSQQENPGQAEFLRRYCHLNVQDLMRFTGRDDIVQQLGAWNADVSTIMGGWLGRIGASDKLRVQFNETGIRLLYSGAIINDNNLEQFSKEIWPLLESQASDRDDSTEYWLEGLSEFRMKHNRQVELPNASDEAIHLMLHNARRHDLIGQHVQKKLEQEKLGSFWPIKRFFQGLQFGRALIAMIQAAIKYWTSGR